MCPSRALLSRVFLIFALLSVCGYVAEFCPKDGSAVGVARWLNYIDHWAERVYQWALTKTNARLVLFKTLNFVCSDVRTNNWADGDAAYTSFSDKAISFCARTLGNLTGFDFSDEEVDRYCRFGQYTEVGAAYLNAQLIQFVAEAQKRNAAFRVGLFRDDAVQSCNTTHDGIHHRKNLALRIRLLANTIESYLACPAPIYDQV